LLVKAARTWDEAFGLRPSAKYAFNAGLAYAHLERWLDAHERLRTARKHPIGPNLNAPLAQLEVRVARELPRTHAQFTLTVDPPAATVVRNGRPWPEPRSPWVRGEHSLIRVTHDGFLPYAESVSHPIGQHTRLSIDLQPESLPPEPDTSALRTWGWSVLGVGIATALGASGALIARDAYARDAESAGLDHYDALQKKHDTALYSGIALGSIALAAVSAGLTLVLWE